MDGSKVDSISEFTEATINAESQAKRYTPAVPTPDWSTENSKTESKCSGKSQVEETSQRQDVEMLEIQTTVANRVQSSSIGMPMTPLQRPESVGSSSVSSQSRILGDVALTPTHSAYTPQAINPHSSLSAATPVSSTNIQAKNCVKMQNCVATVSVGCELKLLDIYSRTRYSEYNPARFNGVVMKILEPRVTALVFRSGKIVCTGGRNEHDAYVAARKIARIIQKLGFPAKFLDFKLLNFIATADLRFPVRLESLQQAHSQFTSYEPELFPGLVYRMVRPRVVLLIFVNGKMVITGGKTRNEVNEAFDIIYPILRSYRKC